MAPSSEYDGVLQNALLTFRQRLHDRAPLQLKHFSGFWEEERIYEWAISQRRLTLSELLKSLSELDDLDEVKVSDVVQEFSKGVDDIINVCIGKHKEYKAEAETLLGRKIADLCNDFKMTLEAKIFLNPQMDVASIEDYFEKGKSIALGSFELQWHHGNQDFFETQKGKLMRKLVKLEIQMLEKQKFLLEEKSQMQTPVYDPSENEGEIIAGFDDNGDIFHFEENSETETTSSNANEIHANEKQPTGNDGEIQENDQHRINSNEGESSINSEGNGDMDAVKVKVEVGIKESQVEVEINWPITISTDIFEKEIEDIDNSEHETENSTKSQVCEKRKQPDDMEKVEHGASSKRQRLHEPTNAKNNEKEINHPLIFRLASDNVTTGTRMDESFTKLKSEFPVVGINEYGNLVYGTSALDPNCDSRWSLMSFLGANPPKKKITFIMGKNVISQELNPEFFLGFLLKNMKDYAENQLKKTFNTAVITLPSWFCSLHRVQVQDAAKVAGFDEVKLMNQETVGALSYVSTSRGNSTDEKRNCDILVLAETFGIVSAILYEWKPGKLRMIADEHKLHSGVSWKEDSNSSKRRQIIYDHYISLRSLLRRNRLSNVDKLLFMTDSQEWMKIFMKVSEKLQYSYDGDEILPPSEMFGSWVLCKKPLVEIREMLREHLTTSVRLSRSGQLSSSPFRYLSKIIPSKTRLPKRVESEMSMKLFRKDEKPTIFQENLICRKMVTLGELDFKKNYCFGKDGPRDREISVLSQITEEAIFVVDGVKVKTRKSGRSEKLSKEEFTWLCPNMRDAESKKLKQLMHSIMQPNREAQTHEYFVVV